MFDNEHNNILPLYFNKLNSGTAIAIFYLSTDSLHYWSNFKWQQLHRWNSRTR